MNTFITLINQIAEMEQKIAEAQMDNVFERNLKRIQNTFEEAGFFVLNPLGEKYAESRTDYEANIVGFSDKNLTITKVIKPIIYQELNGQRMLVQKGIVIVG